MRLVALVVIVAALAVPAFANLVNNGDWATGTETGWTRWNASWSTNESWLVESAEGSPAPCGETVFRTPAGAGGSGSFGWFQRISVTSGNTYALDGMWHADGSGIGTGGWAEYDFFSANSGDSDATIMARIDTGNAADIAFKKGGAGTWGWEAASLSPATGGNHGSITATGNQVVVALKLGNGATGNWETDWDNIAVNQVVVPEPTSMFVLLTGMAGLAGLVRRRR